MSERKSQIYLVHEPDMGKMKQVAAVRETITALLLLSGILLSLWDLFANSSAWLAAMLAGVCMILTLRLTNRLGDVWRGRVRMVIYFAILAAFLVAITLVARGFLDVVNRFVTLWNARFATEWRTFSLDGSVGLPAVVFWILVSAALSALLLRLVRRGRTVALILGGIAALLFSFVVGRSYLWLAVVLLAAAFCMTLSVSATPSRMLHISGYLTVASVVLVFVVIAGVFFGYGGSSRLTAFKENLRAQFLEWRYGSDTLPQGDLKAASGLIGEGEERLTLEMEDAQELYLRGFVGADYNGTSWTALSQESYEGDYAGLLEWLEGEGFSPQTQYGRYREITRLESGGDESGETVSVTNTGAYRKYIYLPATVYSWDAGRTEQKKDWQVRSLQFFGADSYQFVMDRFSMTANEAVPAEWLSNGSDETEQQYLDAESVYHSFVEEYYLSVDETLEAEITELFFPEDSDVDSMDFNQLTSQIRRTLRGETTYTSQPQELPDSATDFVEWFLTEEKEGNAVAYASAAVLAYRVAGYPARYVEGYHYSPDEESDTSTEEETTTVTLTDGDAHAWCEVYVTGMGWLPVEVVPGMYTETYTDQVIEGTPSWEVSTKQDDEGLKTEVGDVIGEEGENQDSGGKEGVDIFHHIAGLVIFVLYLVAIAWLLAELQRFVRSRLSAKNENGKDQKARIDAYVAELFLLMKLAGISGDYNRPFSLAEQVEGAIPGIRRQDYEKALALIQKIRFGGCNLAAWEERIVRGFTERVRAGVYKKSGRLQKIWLRYRYAL